MGIRMQDVQSIMTTRNPYRNEWDRWINNHFYTHDHWLEENSFVKIETPEKKEERMVQELFDKAVNNSYEKTMLEKEKEIMNIKFKANNVKYYSGDAFTLPRVEVELNGFIKDPRSFAKISDIQKYIEERLNVMSRDEHDKTYINPARCNGKSIFTAPLTPPKSLPAIKNVVFNDPLTVIVWEDGTKTYVKASGEDNFDPEKGMALAIAKKAMGNTYNYFETIREWVEKDQKRKAKRAKKEAHTHPEEERIYFDLSGKEPKVIGDHEAMEEYYGEEEYFE